MSVYIDSPRGKEKLVAEFATYTKVDKSITSETRLIIPTVDETLPFFAQNKEWFKQQGIDVMVGSENTVYHCRDKAEFNLFCKRHGFQTPRTWQMNAFVKPRYGKGSRGQVKVNTSFIIQEECTFPEISVDYFADLECQVKSVIPRYRLDVVNGESTKAVIVMEKAIIDTCKRLGRELELVGHNVIQGYWTGEVFILGEVNPRFGGGSWMTFPIFSGPKFLMEKYICMSVKKPYTISPAS